MKTINILLTSVLLIIACTVVKTSSQSTVKAIFDDYTITQDLEDTNFIAPNLSIVVDKFYINMELLVFKSEIEQYPETWKMFELAVKEWTKHIPIRWVLITQDDNSLPIIKSRFGSINIHFCDIQGPIYNLPEYILGIWSPNTGSILLDADYLEVNQKQAYSVSLHELGHMLGVPHIVNFNDMSYTGFIVLEQGHDASNYVMYPKEMNKNLQKILSPIEIELARHNLLHYWTRPDVNHKKRDCKLFLLDNER